MSYRTFFPTFKTFACDSVSCKWIQNDIEWLTDTAAAMECYIEKELNKNNCFPDLYTPKHLMPQCCLM